MRAHRATIADLVARETGKSKKDALGETDAAIEMGFFVAGEGRRFYGQTTTSAVPNKTGAGRAPAARRRRPDHRRQHADRQRGVEGLSGAAVRQRRGAEGGRGHAALGVGVRRARARGRRARGRLLDDSRLRRTGRRAARRASRRRRGELHRLVRGRPLDRADGGEAPGQDVPRARRQEPAHRLRRRRPAERGDLDARLGVQQRRPALRRRQPHPRVRRRLRPVQDDAGRGASAR